MKPHSKLSVKGNSLFKFGTQHSGFSINPTIPTTTTITGTTTGIIGSRKTEKPHTAVPKKG